MALDGRSALVLYGTETGNAQDLAEGLGQMLQRHHFHSQVDELDAVDLSALLKHTLVIIVLSTTGQGDMPRNALLFWKKLLRKKLPPNCLADVRFTSFGLGDSTYVKFNWAARKITKRLQQLGATTFVESYEADEQFDDGIEGCFAPWADNLAKYLVQHHPHPDGLDPVPDEQLLPPVWSLEPALAKMKSSKQGLVPDVETERSNPDTSTDQPLPVPNGWQTQLVENKRLTPASHQQDVRLVSFDISPQPLTDLSLHCNPGDCLTIYPRNFAEDASRLIALMNWLDIADQPLDLKACDPLPRGLHAIPGSTLRDLLLNNIDMTAVPRRSFLRNIAQFTDNDEHRTRLLEFGAGTEFLDEYFDYATRPRRSILEVLDEFPSVRIPAARLLDVFPLIRGRDFSVAGSHSNSSSTRVELLVALVKYRTILRRPREGLCSRYLDRLSPDSTLTVRHNPVLSPIHGPFNARRPLIAMATGTGLAPVRLLIHDRLSHPSPGPTILFFGNRRSEADFFFRDEWRALQDRGLLTLVTAFSRDQSRKIYVQDRLREEGPQLVAPLFSKAPIFAVCGGSSKMADACKRAVLDLLPQAASRDNAAAAADGQPAAVSGSGELPGDATWWQEIW